MTHLQAVETAPKAPAQRTLGVALDTDVSAGLDALADEQGVATEALAEYILLAWVAGE